MAEAFAFLGHDPLVPVRVGTSPPKAEMVDDI